MSRIPEHELERIKAEVSISAYLRERGNVLKRQGTQLLTRCMLPGHSEENESFAVSESKNRFHCFGCGEKGDIINLVSLLEGLSFPKAVRMLRARLPSRDTRQEESKVEPAESAPMDEAERIELLTPVAGLYQRALLDHREALSYLDSRALKSPELFEAHGLGVCDGALPATLPARQHEKGSRLRQRYRVLGILGESGHETLRGCITIPLRRLDKQVVSLYARRFSRRPGAPAHLFLRGPRLGLLNPEVFTSSDVGLLCEAPLDALTWWANGIRSVSSAYGTDGVTEELFSALCRWKHVVLSFDSDAAGQAGAERLAHRLGAQGISVWSVVIPSELGAKDINELAQKVRPTQKTLRELLSRLRFMGAGSAPEAPHFADPSASLPHSFSPDSSAVVTHVELVEPGESVNSVVDAGQPASPSPDRAPPAASNPATPSSSAKPAASPSGANPSGASPSSLMTMPVSEAKAFIQGEEVWLVYQDLRFRVRGLFRKAAPGQLKINLWAFREEASFSDTLELNASKARDSFTRQASEALAYDEKALLRALTHVHLKLEELALEIEKTDPNRKEPKALTLAEHNEAIELLHYPKILTRVVDTLTELGYAGETTVKMIAFLVAVSAKTSEPLALIVVSSLASGKTSLFDAILKLIPESFQIRISAATEKSLYYFDGDELRNKLLVVEELEGVLAAGYPLKNLQSAQRISIATTMKDPETGVLHTVQRTVNGPIGLLTTSAKEIEDEELLSRFFVVALREDEAQTEEIHRAQRKRYTLEGRLGEHRRDALCRVFQNALTLLRPLPVVIRNVERLTYNTKSTRARRDHARYLSLIATHAYLFQYQRNIKSETRGGRVCELIEASSADIRAANELLSQAMGQGLDGLMPHLRAFLFSVYEWTKSERKKSELDPESEFWFTRRQVREATGYGPTQTHEHLTKLESLEYVMSRSLRPQGREYCLLYDGEGQDGSPFVLGLADPAEWESEETSSDSATTVTDSVEDGSDSAVTVTDSADDASDSAKVVTDSAESDTHSVVIRPEFGGNSGRIRAPEIEESPSDNGPLLLAKRFEVPSSKRASRDFSRAATVTSQKKPK